MPRRPRRFAPGAPVHLTAHGIDAEPIVRSDLDRLALLGLISRVTRRVIWKPVAWCLMETHYHLLVFAAEEPRVSWAMQTINSVYAREFNQRHRRRGHVFGERFTDTAVESEFHLHAAREYILDNPVRAGLVRDAADYTWSGEDRLEPRAQLVTNLTRIRDRAVRLRG